MVDCADKERIDEARRELHKIISDREMKDAIILIFANKQDLKGGEAFFSEMVNFFCLSSFSQVHSDISMLRIIACSLYYILICSPFLAHALSQH